MKLNEHDPERHEESDSKRQPDVRPWRFGLVVTINSKLPDTLCDNFLETVNFLENVKVQ